MIDTIEIYCLQWTGTNRIHDDACYDNFERAEKHMKYANKARSFWCRLGGHRWVVRTLKVKLGKRPSSARTKTTT